MKRWLPEGPAEPSNPLSAAGGPHKRSFVLHLHTCTLTLKTEVKNALAGQPATAAKWSGCNCTDVLNERFIMGQRC